jgi:subtilisin
MPAQKPRSRAKSTRTATEDAARRDRGNGSDSGAPQEGGGELTGRYIVTFREGAEKEAMSLMSRSAGISRIARAADFQSGAVDADTLEGGGSVYFDQLGVAVVETPPDAANALGVAASEDDESAILAVEPERIMYALQEDLPDTFEPPTGPPPVPFNGGDLLDTLSYLRGYRDSVVHLFEQLSRGIAEPTEAGISAVFADTPSLTWGLQATGVDRSRFSGRGIRVAVLDTGLDLQHPDFVGRSITAQSFISGQTADDGHGHGTHCVGTACGPLRPSISRRYGMAHGSQIFVGKVLSNGGSGADTGILAGINWAVANRCQIISMSLGAQAPPSPAYEAVGRRALAAGTLIIAAAGNGSDRRSGRFAAVSRPANSDTIMAVAAVDRFLRIASFSNRGTPTGGGKVDIAGPGVDVYSSWQLPQRYNTISGTSMATPHVAGIAALWSEAMRVTGASLAQVLLSKAKGLSLSSLDVGAGLVQAP